MQPTKVPGPSPVVAYLAAALLLAAAVATLFGVLQASLTLRLVPFVLTCVAVFVMMRLAQSIRTNEDRANAHLAAIVHSTDDAIVSKDLNGIIQNCNPACERLFGYSVEELVGKPVTILIPPELRDEEPRILERLRRGERIEHFETVRMTKDGRRLDVSLTISPVRNSRGEIIGVSKIARDITETKAATRRLAALEAERQVAAADRERLLESERTARAESERANRIKDDFVAVVSHELRTPLNAILGWTDVLLQGRPDAQMVRGLEVIRRNTQVQAQLIGDLLDISRVVSGKLLLDVRSLDLVGVIEAAIETVQHAADARGVKIEKHLGTKAAVTIGDPARLQQVVWNLLSNAIKFTPSGGRIDVDMRRVGSRMEVAVADDGMGIEPEMLDRIFDRFHQQHGPTTRRHGGLGLGLAIVRHLVELHGGEVWAQSRGPDQGATFTVSLPLVVADLTYGTGGGPDAGVPIDQHTLQDIRVLVVEDEADNRDLIRRMLEAHGAQVFTAATASEAIAQASNQRPDILVSDIGLPDVDGYELIRRIRRLEAEGLDSIPAVALTAFARSEDRTRALRAGYQAHIAKPVEPAELIATLASFVDLLPADRR